MRTSEHRIGSYTNKVGSETTEATYTAIIAAQQVNMQTGYQAYAEVFVPFLASVKEVLDTQSTGRLLRGAYFAAAGELWHLSQVMDGAGVATEAAVIMTKWTSRGLDAPTLALIAGIIWAV